MDDVKNNNIIQIRSRWDSDKILYEGEFSSIREAVEQAVKNGAKLYGAKSICLFYCVGELRRIGLAVMHEKTAMVALGCFCGTEKEAIEAIREKYGLKTAYEQMIKAACAVVKKQKVGKF